MSSKWGTWQKIDFEQEVVDLFKEDWFQSIWIGLIVGVILIGVLGL